MLERKRQPQNHGMSLEIRQLSSPPISSGQQYNKNQQQRRRIKKGSKEYEYTKLQNMILVIVCIGIWILCILIFISYIWSFLVAIHDEQHHTTTLHYHNNNESYNDDMKRTRHQKGQLYNNNYNKKYYQQSFQRQRQQITRRITNHTLQHYFNSNNESRSIPYITRNDPELVVRQEVSSSTSTTKNVLSKAAIEMCTKTLWHTIETTTIVLPNVETFIHTGDIDDLWLRDSAAQVHPLLIPMFPSKTNQTQFKSYIQLDIKLNRIVAGLIQRHIMYIHHDPYANAFRIDTTYQFNEQQKLLGRHDYISTYNYELDSACYTFRLIYNYYKNTIGYNNNNNNNIHNDYMKYSFVLQKDALLNAIEIMIDLWISEQKHEDDEYLKSSNCTNCNKPYRYPGLSAPNHNNFMYDNKNRRGIHHNYNITMNDQIPSSLSSSSQPPTTNNRRTAQQRRRNRRQRHRRLQFLRGQQPGGVGIDNFLNQLKQREKLNNNDDTQQHQRNIHDFVHRNNNYGNRARPMMNVRQFPGLERDGKGSPTNSSAGLTWSGYRPSDDECIYGYLIPSNMFCMIVLDYIMEMLLDVKMWPLKSLIHKQSIYNKAKKLQNDIYEGIQNHGIVQHEKYGPVYAYEVDGFGNYVLMDDANVPSLLSLPYLFGTYQHRLFNATVYHNTMQLLLSYENPYYQGENIEAGGWIEGIGSPHTEHRIPQNIWPMSIAIMGLITTNITQKILYIEQLVSLSSKTNWMHESIDIYNSKKYTRHWFCWADSLYAELVMSITDQCPIQTYQYKVLKWNDPIIV